MQKIINRSFLKWMGGKGRVIPELLHYLPKGERLIEPFVGGGNVFINTDYKQYILADLNQDLINVYNHLKTDYEQLITRVNCYFNESMDYYHARALFNNFPQNLTRAALFIYLNRHCFNGVCRYNKSGQFNVPKGKHKTIYNPQSELLNFANKFNKLLFNISVMHCDYNQSIKQARAGDVIYCDPPYLPLDNAVSFNGYTPYSFDYHQTERLACELYKAVKRGASAVISNHDIPEIRYLFREFDIHPIEVRRSIAANGNRQPAKEIIAVLTPHML